MSQSAAGVLSALLPSLDPATARGAPGTATGHATVPDRGRAEPDAFGAQLRARLGAPVDLAAPRRGVVGADTRAIDIDARATGAGALPASLTARLRQRLVAEGFDPDTIDRVLGALRRVASTPAGTPDEALDSLREALTDGIPTPGAPDRLDDALRAVVAALTSAAASNSTSPASAPMAAAADPRAADTAGRVTVATEAAPRLARGPERPSADGQGARTGAPTEAAANREAARAASITVDRAMRNDAADAGSGEVRSLRDVVESLLRAAEHGRPTGAARDGVPLRAAVPESTPVAAARARGGSESGALPATAPTAAGGGSGATGAQSAWPAAESSPQLQAAGRQTVERVAWMARDGQSTARLKLQPPELGRVDIRLEIDGPDARVQLVSQNAQVRDGLEAMLPRLRDMLSQQGLQLADAQVSDQGAGQARDDGAGEGARAGGRDRLASGDAPDSAADVAAAFAAPGAGGLLDAYA